MDREIKKCKICDEPYYAYPNDVEYGVCLDCKRKAEEKDERR